jgi:hypothetical protein
MTDEISFEDAILETLPFANELKAWCKSHPDFYQALKIIYAARFIHLGGIVTSYSLKSKYPNDEIIGIIAYDYQIKSPQFKQDFIINKGKKYNEFVLYTRSPNGSSKWVKDINEFYTIYGKEGEYANSHHMTLDDLPNDDFKRRGLRAIELAKSLVGGKFVRPSQEKVNDLYLKLMAQKKKTWFFTKKLEE